MPKEQSNSGTNSSGSSYTSYSDGGYRYSNPSGSSYYNTGSGHGFYNRYVSLLFLIFITFSFILDSFDLSGSSGTQSSGGAQYSTHYNYNAGTSNTTSKGSSSK